ncbi:MAG: 4Fe-4S dicluster domain-containing protein [Bryobacterales bacterium]|nr:4Fe-4S dicluster domain-containing protein [Bryobacterales bacterium]
MAARLVFLALCLCSAAYFAWAVARRLGQMRAARPNLRFDDVGARLGRVVREVLLQSRVVARRPVAGVLHALVMWGFFAFAWVSLEHLSLGLIGLEHAEAGTSWYGWFAAVWAGAVLVGIVGLAFRRFVLRPPALGSKLSGGSAMVALLIVGLMTTYLAGWRYLEVGSEAWRLNWWLHTAAFLGMLWVIPGSKHLHLLLAPFAIFFRHGETTSPMRALDEDSDEDFGMLRFSDLAQKDILDVNACVECGRCTDVCPANMAGGTLSPKQVILQMQHGLLATRNPQEDSVAGTAAEVAEGKVWVAEDDLYQCYTCGACEQACPTGIEHVGAKILDLRRGLVSEGRTHSDKLNDLFNTMERAPHNAWGASQEVRRKLVEGDAFPVFDGSQQWLLWLGCGCNYDPHGNDVARAMQKLFDAAKVSWGVLARETCCGEPARRAGNEYLYMELSEKVIDAIEASGAKNVVTTDPHCCRMFDVDYRQNERFEALGVRVFHHTQVLGELLADVQLDFREEPVTYHDPCYLARGRGETAAPRMLLEIAGADVLEPMRHGLDTGCCGAGGAQLYIADDKKEWPGGRVNYRRFDELAATGAKTIAVACPYCPIMLKDAAGHAGREDVQIVDVAELLASRLPAPPA